MVYTEILRKIVAQNINTISKNKIEDDFEGIDSIVFIKIILAIEDYFNIEYPDDKLSFQESGSISKISKVLEGLDIDEEHCL